MNACANYKMGCEADTIASKIMISAITVIITKKIDIAIITGMHENLSESPQSLRIRKMKAGTVTAQVRQARTNW